MSVTFITDTAIHGDCEGETCNRNGCAGIIQEERHGDGCSCHINPPCSYCTDTTYYCQECGWDSEDDKVVYIPTQEERDYWAEENRKREERERNFWEFFRSGLPADKLEYRKDSHSNSSMKLTGWFPPNEFKGENRKKIEQEGTFGGRFEMLNEKKGRFIYIAYTD